MVGTQLYIITQSSTYNYIFRPCILAIVRRDLVPPTVPPHTYYIATY